jgi:hypothetical protein
MLAILFLILFSLGLLIVIPDRWHARREITKRQPGARRGTRSRAHASNKGTLQ